MRRSAPPELSDDDAQTLAREPPTTKQHSPAMQLLVANRPRDPVGAGRVLANLESKLLQRRTAEPVAARYVLLQEIGAGGIGRVYSAYDPELDRRIAVKFLHAYAADEQASARLVREAQAMAKLSHPNVVAVYDVGMLDRQVFIAMELVDGLSLSKWIKAQPRQWSEVRDMMLEAGKGLVAAHEAGLVHRDFKPANVLVGDDGRVRVLDFGLARRVQAHREGEGPAAHSSSTLDAQLTATGTIMGTPAYMAPEQIEGVDVGPAADQFAFCVTLYEGLFGHRPFTGEDTPGLCRAILEREPSPPPAGHTVPSWLVKACLRGLAKAPADRFPTMQALLEALQADRKRRRRSWVALGLVAMLSAGGAAVAATWLAPSPTASEHDAIEQLAIEARAAAARTYYVYPPPEEPQLRTAYRIVRELEALSGPAADAGRDRALELRGEFASALVRIADGLWEREGGAPFAVDYYASALVFDPDHAHAQERSRLSRGERLALVDKAERGEFTRAELLTGESLAILAEPDPDKQAERVEALVGGDDGPGASTMARLEQLLDQPARKALTKPARRRKTVVAFEEPSEPAAPEVEEVEAVHAEVEVEDEDAPEAGRSEKPAAKVDPKALVDRGNALRRTQNYAEARQVFNQALKANRRHAGALGGLARLEFDLGNYDAALRDADRAVRAAPGNASLRLLYGDTLRKVRRYEDARRQFEKAKTLGAKGAVRRLEELERTLGE